MTNNNFTKKQHIESLKQMETLNALESFSNSPINIKVETSLALILNKEKDLKISNNYENASLDED